MKYSELSPDDQRHAVSQVLIAITQSDHEVWVTQADLEYEAANLEWVKNPDGTLEFEM
ncbi:hypothetical protein [Caproiciproducens galactitolivorans]|uniref:Uncharacterized protein n=1 Tax=Caproiciproducens galactitolivorans TaxID=642589 RepID=A0ABT4BWE3_9FIRM|nr:hypothetical protein [Caproiciproducens galactitolivorans]MCY1715212.1 hypothetical protein [Caproiciproducens galactitolivorans]